MDHSRSSTFGDWLRRYRLAAGLTQEELAEKAQLSPRAISDLERGQRNRPYRETVKLLADALQLEAVERGQLQAAARAQVPGASEAPRSDTRPEVAKSPTNLPVSLTPLIGRERELAGLRERLLDPGVRLLTLTGPGGIGKTRLALQLGVEVRDAFPDGLEFVPLASLTDPTLVASTIAQSLGLPVALDRSNLDILVNALRSKQVLLMLDNFEHLVGAAPVVAELLARSPKLKVLMTSRSLLLLQGERIFEVPPLDLPVPRDTPTFADLSQSSAVRLFVERARGVRPDFVLTEENASVVAEICRRVDGIPLAVELAAAWTRLLPPQALLARLERRLPLLTGGARDLTPRQQSMRRTIAWSYDLLSPAEQRLFRRLVVFRGGFTLEAAESVGGDSDDHGLDVLEGVASLADKSLLQRQEGVEGEPRLGMLETIREYGWERLEAAGEADLIAGGHAAYYLADAEKWSTLEHSARQSEALARFALEQDNLGQAVDWWMSRDLECALRLVSALSYAWWRRGRQTELQRWYALLLPHRHALPRSETLARFLRLAPQCTDDADLAARRALFEESVTVSRGVGDRRGAADALWMLATDAVSFGDYPAARALYTECLADADAELRVRTLIGAAILARRTGEFGAARTQLEEAIVSSQQSGVPMDVGFALDNLGKLERIQGNLARAVALSEASLTVFRDAGLVNVVSCMYRALGRLARLQGDYSRARILQRQALAAAREIFQRPLEAEVLDELGLIAAAEGDLAGARPLLEEALAIVGDRTRWEATELIASLGLVARAEGKLAEARQLFDEALTFWRKVGNPRSVAVVTGHLGVVALQEGNLSLAGDLFSRSLVARHALGDQGGTATLLECFAGLASLGDEPERAFQLVGAADRIRSAIGNPAPPIWQKQRDAWMEPARRALDHAPRLQTYVSGQTAGWEGAIPEALRLGQRI